MGVYKQVTYNTAGNIVTLFCQWMILMIVPKITDFAEAGVFAVALSICSIMNIFATFSLNQYQISDQYARYSENEYRAARLVTIFISFVLCLPVVLFFNYSLEQNLIIILYMVYRNLIHYAFLYTATLQIRERLDYAGKCMILEGITSFISFTAVYYFTHDLILSVGTMAVLGGGIFLLSVAHGYRKVVGRRYPWHRADPKVTRSLVKFGAPLLFSVVAPIVIVALPKIILQAVEGDEIVGIFSTLSAPTIVVPTLVISIFAPFIIYFSNISRKGEMSTLRKQYSKTVLVILLFGGLCYVLSNIAAGYLFELAYGDEIASYVGYFNILVVGITFYSIGMCGVTVLITKEQGRAAAISSALALAVSLVIFVIAIPAYGIGGATYGLMAAYGVFGLFVSLCVLFLPLSKAVRIWDTDV